MAKKKTEKNVGGRKPSRSLFKQWADNPDEAIYDLDEMHDTFVSLGDLTEYKPAIELVGSWAEWNRIKNGSPVFADHINQWKEEIRIKNISIAQEKIFSLIDSESSSTALSAAKWFAENGPERRMGAGRPSKKEIAAQEKALAKSAQVTKDELSRVKNVLEFKKAN